MFLTKLAFKNLLRHRNRTLITANIIAFAIFFYIFLDSMIGGMTEMSYQSIIDYEAGHLQVVNQEYWEKENELPLDNLLVVDEDLLGVVKGIKGYQSSSVELNFKAMLNNGVNELPVVGKGINPEQFLKVFNFEKQFVEGEMFTTGEYRAVMGKRLADLLKLQIGDYITLLVQDKNETFNTIEAELAGLVHTGNPNINSNYVYLPLDIVQKGLNVDNQVSKMTVILENKSLASELAGQLKSGLNRVDKGLAAYSWEELEAVSIAGAKQMGNQLIMTIILLIAAIAIINTVILAALERLEEIGMMKAMGLRTREVIYTFVLESTGIGILGGTIGVVLGAVGVWFLSTYGIDFGALTGVDLSSFGVPILGKLYGIWNPESFILVYLFGVVVCLLSSLLPAYWAADKDPVKAIYHR